LTIRATSSDGFFAARGWRAAFAGVFALAVFVALDFGALALRAFAGFFAALAFFGADFAPVVLRVRIQILRSAQTGRAKRDVLKFRP
jgi:hypothetical protein